MKLKKSESLKPLNFFSSVAFDFAAAVFAPLEQRQRERISSCIFNSLCD